MTQGWRATDRNAGDEPAHRRARTENEITAKSNRQRAARWALVCAVPIMVGVGMFAMVMGGWHPLAIGNVMAGILWDGEHLENRHIVVSLAMWSGIGATLIAIGAMAMWQLIKH